MSRPLVLASASPRRRALLAMLDIPHVVAPVSIEEVRGPDEGPGEYAARLARTKATVGAREHPGQWVLGADTIVVHDGQVLEKPADGGAATVMLETLAGEMHEVITALALAKDGVVHERSGTTRVWFADPGPEAIREYVATGEPLDKAGGYGIQGKGAVLVERIEGDYFGVMGLSVRQLVGLLDVAGLPYRFIR